MYKLPGVRSGTWLTEKEETYSSPKGISNYGLVPVTYKNADKQGEKTKKEIGEDFQKLLKNTVAASKTTKDAIKKAYDWTGIWGLSTLGSAGGLAYVLSQYPNDEYGWLKGALFGSMVASGTKLVNRIEKKRESYKKQKAERGKMKIQKEIRDLLKEFVRTPVNGDLDRKIGYKERLKILSKTLEKEEEMEPKRIEQIREEEITPIKESMENYYKI